MHCIRRFVSEFGTTKKVSGSAVPLLWLLTENSQAKFLRRTGDNKPMRFKTLITLLTLLLVAALALPSFVAAQSTTNGAISGTVTDPSGAVLPNLTVTLKSVEKGFTQ